MQVDKEIGGYFGLELNDKFPLCTDNSCIALNTGRNCIKYIIRAFNIREIWIPYYTCPVVWNSAEKENCSVKFYHIDENFMPSVQFEKNDFILYTNYYGICAKNVKLLSSIYKNLIVDNSQAFYMPKYGIASFNSVRKFFGVPDGAFLYCDKKSDENLQTDKTSVTRFVHLLKRIDSSAREGYNDFRQSDKSLDDEPVKLMSCITKALIKNIDICSAKQKRLMNFNFLHENLKNINKLKFELDKDDVPMVYPFLSEKEGLKEKLIKNKIYVATYWNNLPDSYKESVFQKYIVPLPIDQRYCEEDMRKILEILYA